MRAREDDVLRRSTRPPNGGSKASGAVSQQIMAHKSKGRRADWLDPIDCNVQRRSGYTILGGGIYNVVSPETLYLDGRRAIARLRVIDKRRRPGTRGVFVSSRIALSRTLRAGGEIGVGDGNGA